MNINIKILTFQSDQKTNRFYKINNKISFTFAMVNIESIMYTWRDRIIITVQSDTKCFYMTHPCISISYKNVNKISFNR